MVLKDSTNQDTPTTTLSNDPIILVCAADNNYVMPLAVTLRSTIENLSSERQIKIYVIDGGIKQENKERLLKSVKSKKLISFLFVYPSEDLLADVEVSSYYTKAIFYRLLIPDLIPEHSKAIYLDSDVVVNADLGELWDIGLDDYYLLAARDQYFPTILSASCLELFQSQNLRINKFFNSGVLVIDLEKWRIDKTSNKIINFISKYKLLDQEGLNILLKDKWKEISPLWNQSHGIYECKAWDLSPFSQEEYNALLNNPFIIHYTSSNKPWNSIDCHPFQSLFYHYLDLTAWAGWRFDYIKLVKSKLYKRLKTLNLFSQ